jgi:hypothetical protein
MRFHMGNLKKKFKDHEKLRQAVDGKSTLFDGVSTHGGGWAGHNERLANTPEWALNETQLRAILHRAFPKWKTNPTQLKRAKRWVYIILHYFRMGETALQISMELSHLGRSAEQVSADWDANPKQYSRETVTVKQVTDAIRRISRVAQGLRANGEPRSGKPGRPKLNNHVIT